ncbi:hypothetical protein D8B26_004449 [Coccidioides posadasii str. Silveira]|uniref:Uncharacterized protein n=2 Tax=Coccidioides posadasii TaxID=199306 RepID=E9DK47_COCPS|nr:hypothetical protein CPC735_021780 [Coccidioides posadasii C735 delta SOWgp]EER22879.1 hypothetical protein CPC735_021780 [Coccidioides posadasii C735 delta SOWgp]EFW13222.1 conserved hypothetical protein [Coccidioides posadasii str. Silveira]QVM09789.1 hypothetical protein D8B26_004449 [Coccidioides posadasii str. Silveira]|eukprot:XP_003065024.1 hypothetical protein CPC735_021780 [Coccidioides posadasii C735 delta SOWgp]
MAPPRQRGTAAGGLDDSRSEASTGQRERQTGATKGRRAGNTAASVAATASKDARQPQPEAVVGDPEQGTVENPGINWSSMPLSVLHQYRYVHKLQCPSAFSSRINPILLSRGIGYRSPTAIAMRNAQKVAKKNGDKGKNFQPSSSKNPKDFKSTTGEGLQRSRIGTAYGRVSKEHLASAVRKHFNNTAISEQDAIAKFVYKVSEERKGREFRYRFQPS